MSAGRGTLLLTVLGGLSQLLGFGYRVALSRAVGAEVMGLYQLVMPVYSVLMSLTAVGLTAAVSNLTSRYLALGSRRSAEQTLVFCLRLFFLLLFPVGAVVIPASDFLSTALLGDARTQLGLMLLVPCVALTGVENLHKHAFYGAGRVVAPAVVELLEQFIRAAAVLGLLWLFLPQYPERVVGLIVTGMVLCEVFSSLTLTLLHRIRRLPPTGQVTDRRILRRQVGAIALPMAANALLGNLMGAANTALIPQLLVAGGLERSEAVARLGVVCGMTAPMLALPTLFIGPLCLILVPRLARADALGDRREAARLTGRAMWITAIAALPTMAWMAVLAPGLGQLLYRRADIGQYALPLAAATALGCFCAILAAALNATGRQRDVAAVTLLVDGIQLVCTLVLIPRVGLAGYAVGTVAATGVELVLFGSLARGHIGLRTPPMPRMLAPGLAALLSALTGNLLLNVLTDRGLPPAAAIGGAAVFGAVLYGAALMAQGVEFPRAAKKRPVGR